VAARRSPKRREISGVYWSVIGHRLRVGAAGGKGQRAGVVQCVWIGVEMWERGVKFCGVAHNWVPHLRDAGVPASLLVGL
jgi:hypothetical protein